MPTNDELTNAARREKTAELLDLLAAMGEAVGRAASRLAAAERRHTLARRGEKDLPRRDMRTASLELDSSRKALERQKARTLAFLEGKS